MTTFKPKVEDYVFELGGVDIEKTEITYFWLDIEYKTIENGVSTPYEHKRGLDIEILGSKEESETSVEIAIDCSLEELNDMDTTPIDITKSLIEGECFIKYPNKENYDELDIQKSRGTDRDMKHNLSSLFVLKEKENRFIFKLSVPSEQLFTYFTIDFDKNE